MTPNKSASPAQISDEKFVKDQHVEAEAVYSSAADKWKIFSPLKPLGSRSLSNAMPTEAEAWASARSRLEPSAINSIEGTVADEPFKGYTEPVEAPKGNRVLIAADMVIRSNYLIGRCIPLLHILNENEQAVEVLREIKEYIRTGK